MQTQIPDIIFAQDGEHDLMLSHGDIELQWGEVEAAEGQKPSRSFEMVAYSGGPMQPNGFPIPVVVDLNGMDFSNKSRPILRQHDANRIVGHSTAFRIEAGALLVEGVVSASNEHAREVIESSREGFPWQASIGARITKRRLVAAGKTVEVNGRKFTGPLLVAEKSVIKEVSFVALGADDDTSAKIAASLAAGETDMKFAEWLRAKGFDPTALDTAQESSLRAAFNMEQEIDELRASAGGTGDDASAIAELRAELGDQLKTVREQIEASARESQILAASAGDEDIFAQAMKDGWSVDKTELEVMRKSTMHASFGIHTKSGLDSLDEKTLTAAACMSAGIDGESLVGDRKFGEQAVNAADEMGALGVRDLIAMACRMEGKSIPLTAGDDGAWMQAAFSTHSLPSIMSNTMNKVMLSRYEAFAPVALDLCKVGTVKDFKQVTRHRILGTGAWQKVAADGELKSITLGEDGFSNQADTHGQIFYLTRKDVINDDLGAFMELPGMMGEGAAHLLEDQFFTLMNAGGFFSAPNGNLNTGAPSAFGYDSVIAAQTAFKKQKRGPGGKDKDKRPINIRPTTVVVPTELEMDAEHLFGSANFVGGDGQLNRNPLANKYTVKSSVYLSDSAINGSATAWYLMANPGQLAAYEAVFLNGKRTPTIERVNGPENKLVGMGFRGYFDFGFAEMDPRAIQKNAGA